MATSVFCDPDRTRGFFHRPFPDDSLRTPEGTLDLRGLPLGAWPAAALVANYIRLAALSCRGFGLHTPAYFLLDGAPACRVPERIDTPGPEDPIVLVSLDDAAHRPPLKLHYFATADRYVPAHLLAFGPQEHSGYESGRRYAAVVLTRLAQPAPRISVSHALAQMLGRLGIDARCVAAATSFTVQHVNAELLALRAAAEDFLHAAPPARALRRIRSLAYGHGRAPSGRRTWVLESMADGGARRTHFHADGAYRPLALDLAGHGAAVYELEIPVPRFVAGNGPAASRGWRIVRDIGRSDGIIAFRENGDRLAVSTTPSLAWKRVVLQLPAQGFADNLTVYDHGTGGSAYCALARPNAADRGVTRLLPGTAVVSHDQPLFGLGGMAEQGYPEYLAAYHPIHLAGARDYLRQAALESWYVYRWLEARSIGIPFGWRRALKFGHSLGSVTANLAMALHGERNPFDKVFNSGAGGFFTMYALHSAWPAAWMQRRPRLKGIADRLGIAPQPALLLARALGSPVTSVDEFHPVLMLAQMLLDGADPVNFIAATGGEHHYWIGEGDWQVPNYASELLIRRKPGHVTRVPATADYDPHYALFREDLGGEVIRKWIGL